MAQNIKSRMHHNTKNGGDVVDDTLKYENGEMSLNEEIAYFQRLINSGEAWQFQGSYGRQAMALIEAGYCMLGEQGHKDYWGNYVPGRHEVKAGTKGSIEYCQKLHPERKIPA